MNQAADTQPAGNAGAPAWNLDFRGERAQVRAGETVLDALLRQGIDAKFSCRGGTCMTCLNKFVSGTIPAQAQEGVKPELAAQGYATLCTFHPESDLVVVAPDPRDFRTVGVIETCAAEPGGGWRITLELETVLDYRRGQRFEIGLPGQPAGIAIGGATSAAIDGLVLGDPAEDYYFILRIGDGEAQARFASAQAPGARLELRGPLDAVAEPAPAGVSLCATCASRAPDCASTCTTTSAPARLTAPAVAAACVPAAGTPGDPAATRADERRAPPPDPELWRALDEGALLRAIVLDFYERVFEDDKLKSFFHGVTRERVAEKQIMFLREIITGQPGFFGERPRNAHHWMVITGELFDYREELLAKVMREHGLAESWCARWRALHEFYRTDIVKSEAIPRMMGGLAMPLDGFAQETLTVGALCDGCGDVLAPGAVVRYHSRLGTISCARCVGDERVPAMAPA